MRTRVWVVALVTTFFIVLALSGVRTAGQAGPASVPNPLVTGPIPLTAPPGDPSHGYPFFSTTVDLASDGYVEEEYFFEGTANIYNMPAADNLTGTPTVAGSSLYRTRMIVRRPVAPERFNGTVLMEWQNVTAGYDLDAEWVASWEHIVRRGYAWVGVSAQRTSVHNAVVGLKAWSPVRYGTLNLSQGDALNSPSFDIFSQAAQAVRQPSGVDPMGGLVVERVFGVGVSQAAIRVARYHNAIHPLAGVFDAFAVLEGGGKLRTDLVVKAFKLLSETDIAGTQTAIRQADSDHFRRWEVAGSAHLDFYAVQGLAPLQARDLGPSVPPTCSFPPYSGVPSRYVGNALMDAMSLWVRDGIEPETGLDIATLSITPLSAVIDRDSAGNARGGIRLSQHEVPTATNTGVNVGPGYCSLYGTHLPFDDATLAALYRSHGAYVSRVSNVTGWNLAAGFIVAEDAEATIREAAQSSVGKQ